ncbi:Hypothetical predicted protein [Lynx pardinus]|uniref:Uncharacterized protein n=1 Tax=Lynx pardinus TaxID=191816 RepID=A0A485MK90_LYNPA|nr:Hypothetical predicted protein [Lynx pardinus]
MLDSSTNTPSFKEWKATHKDGNARGTALLEALCCILLTNVQRARSCFCPSRISTKLVLWVLSLWAEERTVFSTLAWWSPLFQSALQMKWSLLKCTMEF